MTAAEPLRDVVAAQLSFLTAPGHVLNTDSDRNTYIRYAADVRSAKFRKRVVAKCLDRQNPVRGGLSAMISAGAPGAGKSTALRARAPDLDGYRILDADIVKDALLE
ncbi:hypothetical protein G4X40_09170 [Rhodococcus sp. D2-41]|uniref:hypothetical protein n=1 Tax=Speluncibacter jeojiensis TaxID=2710754 RepID=UPI00240FB533|nr:hypothetical protein [Rhodococcus sp. D2-41]MDG3010322.1 hypothetical protein [Rhodococcus sp. D2-41]